MSCPVCGEENMPIEPVEDDHSDPLPHVFIGSSSASLPLAHRIQEKLEIGNTIAATVWDKGIFALGGNVLDDLLRYVSSFDFAILILSTDDLTSSKGRRMASPRDNVIFELGLFMGVRGRRRAFTIIIPTTTGRLKLPSDLDGNISLRLNPEKIGDDTYLTEQINWVRDLIQRRSRAAALSLLPSAGLAFGYFHNFLVPVCSHLGNIKQVEIGGSHIEIDKTDFNLIVIIAPTLANAAITGRDRYVREAGLLPYSFRKEPREYGFFVYPPRRDEPIRFADYPTTLRSSLDVIRLALHAEELGGEFADIQTLMEQQEIANFTKALRYLLKDPDAAGFKDKVKIVRLR
jgi:hypothetical protein